MSSGPVARRAASAVDHDLILGSPVARALAVIGDRWTLLVMRDMFLGIRRFEELRRRSGAARGTLAARLKSLVDHGLLEKQPYQDAPLRYEYRLTRKGLDLYPLALAIWDWETKWGHDADLPPALIHQRCSKTLQPLFRCAACHDPIAMREVRFRGGKLHAATGQVPARFQRRGKAARLPDAGVDRRFFHVLDIIGDRWTGLVVAALYFGLNRYDEIVSGLGIATNILADRLKLLLSVGVLRQVPYQRKPLRYDYRLTDKGAELYINALQMHEWAMRWLVRKGESPLSLEHVPCGRALRSEMVCSECGVALKADEVRFDRDPR